MTSLPPLTTATLWDIINDNIDDDTVHHLIWHYLGYRFDDQTQRWSADSVAPEWREDYPEPPDFIESRPATVKLTRSIPKENKQLLKEQLQFSGYKVDELVPRKTRRATIVSWLLSYAKEQGLTLE